MGTVFVIGSVNQDHVLVVDHRPEPGETVTGAVLDIGPGGKGANQAAAAAAAGAQVALLARVGDDAAGHAQLHATYRATGWTSHWSRDSRRRDRSRLHHGHARR